MSAEGYYMLLPIGTRLRCGDLRSKSGDPTISIYTYSQIIRMITKVDSALVMMHLPADATYVKRSKCVMSDKVIIDQIILLSEWPVWYDLRLCCDAIITNHQVYHYISADLAVPVSKYYELHNVDRHRKYVDKACQTPPPYQGESD